MKRGIVRITIGSATTFFSCFLFDYFFPRMHKLFAKTNIPIEILKSPVNRNTNKPPFLEMTSSEQATLVDEYPIESILNQISPWFDVEKTKYGGRGCFATDLIPKGTIIHQCSSPVGSTIAKPFKKEVCTNCFKYEYGSTMKSKVSKKLARILIRYFSVMMIV